MFLLQSNINIGQYFVLPHEVKITKSVHSFVDKCVIKVPVTARIKQADAVITESADTAKIFNAGDFVFVELGYNGTLRKEFVGFVSRINFTTPVEIECEGYSYQLRQKTYGKFFKNTSLKNILEYLVTGTDIILDPKSDAVPVVKFLIDEGTTGTDVLEKLKKHLSNAVSFIFTDNVLYAGIQYLDRKTDVKYRLGWNVIKDNNLKLHQAKNEKVQVVAKKNDGTTVTVFGGNGKVNKVYKTSAVTDTHTLQKMADNLQSKINYDGYEGKMTCFLQPFCIPGYRGIIEDKRYPERSGKYIVESTEVSYGTSGARRIVEIGKRL